MEVRNGIKKPSKRGGSPPITAKTAIVVLLREGKEKERGGETAVENRRVSFYKSLISYEPDDDQLGGRAGSADAAADSQQG